MPKLAINTASSGVNVIVAAKTGLVIRLLHYVLVSAGTVTVQWQSHTVPTNLTGAMTLIEGVPLVCPPTPNTIPKRQSYVDALVGESLDLNLGSGVQVSGHIEYVYENQ